MDSRRICYTLGFLALFAVPILTQDTDDDYVPFWREPYSGFDWDLLKNLRSSENGNVIISPLSVKMVLAMLYEGATGETEQELQTVLQFPVTKVATRDTFLRIVSSILRQSDYHTLDMGSRIFMDKSLQPQQKFTAQVKTFYDTDVKSIDFSKKSEARDEINAWADNITHGRITDLVKEGDLEDAVILLTNALYYKGIWKNQFNRSETKPGLFYTSADKPITVDYMTSYSKYYYHENEKDGRVIRLPFKGRHFSMYIIVPTNNITLNEYLEDFTTDKLKRMLWSMNSHKINVQIPKFAITYDAKLKNILQEIGLKHIFDSTASLPGIVRGKGAQALYVSDVIQKAGIEINEEGSTAFAATVASLNNRFGDPNFTVTKPFIYYIEDETTGSILFSGKIETPTLSENQ